MDNRKEEITALINELLQPILDEQVVDLVGIKVSGQARRFSIEVFVDHPTGGITIAQCTLINRVLTKKIEADQLIAEDFMIAVSSPGIEWPLVTEKDFARVLNRVLKVSLCEPLAGKIEFVGTLLSVSAGEIILKSETGDLALPLAQIQKAVQFIK